MHRGLLARALPQRGFEIGRPIVLAQQVPERFVREFLKLHHAVARQKIERRLGLIVELHPFARHLLRLFLA